MDLSRRLRSTALIVFICLVCVQKTNSRFHGLRHKRQNGANLFLPESSVTPGGEGDDPSEWTGWSSPSECSRSCGGGVSYQMRECLRTDYNGEPICTGGDRRYYSCNTQDCPEDEPDFRAQQCARFNRTQFDGVFYNWVPYMNAANPCELNCMPQGERFYYRQKEKVIDGTRCNDKDFDVCVNGKCQPVGCDMMLGSNAKEDKCRQCNGDGSSCKTIADTFSTPNLAAGYNDILLVPSGATNIRIEETAPSNNYLACRNLTGHYYLNGNWRIDFPRPMFYAGCWWSYQRRPAGFAAPDQLTCSGPITEAIYIVMLVQDKNVSIDYEYSIPDSLSQSTPDIYTWTHMEYGPCSASCGGGSQTREVKCNNRLNLQEVDPSFCDEQSKPAESQQCGIEPCAPHWVEGEWGKCSKGCGADGFQNRTITCQRISPTGEQTSEEDAVCLKLVGNKPATTQECNRDVENCPKYHLGPWTPCDKLCDEGKQTRKVTCYIEENGHKRVLNDEDCVEEKPETEKPCTLAPCEGVDWITSEWSGCSACGQNTETRTAICTSKSGKVYPDEFCAPEVPLISRSCKSKKCQSQWFTSEWSKCSTPCGKGVQNRIVICGEYDGKLVKPAAESKCDAAAKPESQQECEGVEKECPGQWFTGPWTSCNKQCGGGERVREVFCLFNGTKADNCDESKLEPISEKCNTQVCKEEEGTSGVTTESPVDGEEEEEECIEVDEDEVESATSKLSENLKLVDGVDLDESTVTQSSLITDEVMLSDSPYDDTSYAEQSTEVSPTTEGSGEETDDGEEGSGDDESTTDIIGSTSSEGEGSSEKTSEHTTGSTESTESTSEHSTESTEITSEHSTESTSEHSTESTESTSEHSTESTSEHSTESTESTSEHSTESTESTSEHSTESTESTSEHSTESTESTSEHSTESTQSTSEHSTESTESTSEHSTESSESTSEHSTESTESTSEHSTESTESTSEHSTESTESTSEHSTESTSDHSTGSTESTSDHSTESTESTSEHSTKSTESTSEHSTESTESTSEHTTGSTESTSEHSTESTESTSEHSTESSESTSEHSTESTESTSEHTTESTESTSEHSTESTESTSEHTTGSTESTSEHSTESTESTTDHSTESTESTSEHSTESTESTSEHTTESTESTSEHTTESTESTSEHSTESTESTSEHSTESTESTSEHSTESTESTSEHSTESTESTSEHSTESTESTSAHSTESTESTSEHSTESTSEHPTESTESTSEHSTESTESTSEHSTESTESTSEHSTESTESTSEHSTESTESTSEHSTESTESTSEHSTESTESSTEHSTESTESTSEHSTESTESTSEHSTESTSEYSTESSESTSEHTTGSTESTSEHSTESTESTSEHSTESTSEHSTESTESTSEHSTESTESTSEHSTDSTESTSEHSTESTSESSTESTSEHSTESTESTSEHSTESTESTSEHSTISSESTESTSPHSTVSVGSTESSLSTEEGTTEDIWSTNTDDESSTPNTFTTITTIKPRKCKPKKGCKNTEHGCCPDQKTRAKGPFDEGCPIAKTCADTKFGCCSDGVSPAQGPKNKGCPKSQCAETLFGCCSDKFTPAEGENGEGCPEPTTLPPTTTVEVTVSDVEGSGDDGTTSTSVQETTNTSDETTTTSADENTTIVPDRRPDDCRSSTHGCCPDGRTVAAGPDGEGCAACTREPFGCCPDKQTPAHGPLNEGCCLNSPYGCCPDNINSARGPNFEDCDCKYTPYGCCPDQKSAARGPDAQGCPCETTQHGCCPDKITSAKGPKFEGCACETTQFGCCPDGITFAQGPHHYGCHCSQTKFKCCQDDKTPAKGPNFEGCTCLESKHGCCPDGISAAEGDKFEGCANVKEPRQKSCALPKETGPCSNFSIKYHFDTTYGACAKFWYGGCEGNDNRFESESECKQTCEDYKGKDVCFLPKISGPCTSHTQKWYFDADRNRCEQFTYGGCYGNNNRFETLEECQSMCTASESIPPCEQPAEAGPCEGNFERWYYHNETDVCRPFTYGGCKGNKNNYPSEHACNYNCRQPGVLKDSCSLPKQTGDCSDQHPRWYFSESDKRCMPFYYTGCGGNKNNFPSLESCEDHCPKQIAKNICEIPAQVGECTNYTSAWYFDTSAATCQHFYYGGCGGNENRFQTQEECLARCEKPEPTLPPEPPANVCAEQPAPGECSNYAPKWYFDSERGICNQFYYGGCGGNGNRFASKDDCEYKCGRQTPPESPQQPPEQSPQQPPQQPIPEPESHDLCSLPSDQGECGNWEINYFYNSADGKCQQFYYGGCGGNDNRFKSENECNSRCPLNIPPENKCFLPAEYGECYNNETRWFYNSEQGLCDEFVFSGCGGNANNYGTEAECNEECIDAQSTCSLPPVRGRCNENSIRWYYDQRSERCHEFEFTGCRGNTNNFVTEIECLNFCNTDQQPQAPPEEPIPPENSINFCNLPVEAGECDNYTRAWYYDSERMACTEFTYTGCGGNNNRFGSQEQCERQCGEFKEIDVCNQNALAGPCTQWEMRFFYNQQTKSCEPFTYGGCDGNGNRFIDRAECESVCISDQEPPTKHTEDICQLPVATGSCNGVGLSERRWYYDDEIGNCMSFIYSGCSGNQNNFRSYEACNSYCGRAIKTTETPNEIQPNRCESLEEECNQMRCPYGVRRVAQEECTRCECENPCERLQCPEGQQCVIDFINNEPETVCRDINKPGECPQLAANSSDCVRECYTDADCREDNKCCSNGCSYLCVLPVIPTIPTTRPTTQSPIVVRPGEVGASFEPKSKPELDVRTSIGGIAVLRCFATGNPAPNVSWSLGNVVIDTNQGRYVLTSSGDLTIVQVRQTDDGTYVCVASNGLGEPVRREVTLQVTEPKDIPAYVYGERNATQIVTLNRPADVRCPAGGYPQPHVTWWRNRKRLGLINDRFEQLRDNALRFRSIELSDLGPYTCDVYNGHGKPASLVITLKAIGPVRATTNEDAKYLEYIIEPRIKPEPRRPEYPYDQSRPVYEVPSATPVNAQAVIGLDPNNNYNLGSTIAMSCAVQGYPLPDVTWAKDGVPLINDGRVQITSDPHRLVVNDVTTEDTGVYSCTARNQFSYNTSEDRITIESTIPVSPECIDNPYFANCKLIVAGQYCRNHYYAKFCCRSCTLAGQIMQSHPNAL